jgi:BRCA1-associated protein
VESERVYTSIVSEGKEGKAPPRLSVIAKDVMNVSLRLDLDAVRHSSAFSERLQAAVAPDPQPGKISASDEACFRVTVSSLNLSSSLEPPPARASSRNAAQYAGIFLPATLTDSALSDVTAMLPTADCCRKDPQHSRTDDSDAPPDFCTTARARTKLSQRLLSMVHPFLAQNFGIKGIVAVRQPRGAPADLVLVDLTHTPASLVTELLQLTNGQVIYAGSPELVLQVIVIAHVTVVTVAAEAHAEGEGKQPAARTSPSSATSLNAASSSTNSTVNQHNLATELPSCPVCWHRIDPICLNLPRPGTAQLCSAFCAPPNLLLGTRGKDRRSADISCPNQRLLLPWPRPAHCDVCRAVEDYWHGQSAAAASHENDAKLACNVCAMQQTLWVCLTCAFLGCGRYSNKHAADHYTETGHAYSLELATLRIWDYWTSGFCHRTDLLACPSAPPLLQQPWMSRLVAGTTAPRADASSSKSPQKAGMVGEEYEALLQSALEDQAQHYEGQVAHVRAQLLSVEASHMTVAETCEVQALQSEIAGLQTEIQGATQRLLAAQSQEAEARASSQRLLRGQQVAQDVLAKLQEETAQEQEQGRILVEELEQQIADLTANQRYVPESVFAGKGQGIHLAASHLLTHTHTRHLPFPFFSQDATPVYAKRRIAAGADLGRDRVNQYEEWEETA